MITVEEAKRRLLEKFSDVEFLREREQENMLWALVKKESLIDVAVFAKHDLGMILPVTNTAEDNGSDVEVWYHVENLEDPFVLHIGVRLVKPDITLPTLIDVWQGMNWHERESWDLVGVIFEGHPNLTRILNPDDWDGHPLQKKARKVRSRKARPAKKDGKKSEDKKEAVKEKPVAKTAKKEE